MVSNEKIKVRLLKKTYNDLVNYVIIHNCGYSTEPWFGTLQEPAFIRSIQRADYDATFIAEVNGRHVDLIDIKCYRRWG
jgi:hypothetical protein